MLNSLPAWPYVYLYPPLLAVALWAGLTALVAGLNRRGPRAGQLALLASLPLLVLAHHELHLTADSSGPFEAYRAFIAGTLIWAWHELAFYSGILTGPWRKACPPEARGMTRFGYALGTHLYHELAVVLEVGLMLWLLHGGNNLLGLLVFVLSWALQHSAKLNVLLGVPALNVALFPPHLRYLGSYWRERPANFFFIPSLSVFTLLTLMLMTAAHTHRFEAVGVRLALLATLVGLGALEHWLLAPPGRRVAVRMPSQAID